MRFSKIVFPALLLACLCMSGCYQAQVTTNRSAGDTVVEKKWASSFILGIVPATVDVSDQCPNGIASAERKYSFLNMLVGGLTLNLYLPQTVRVTCAAGGSMSQTVPREDAEFTLREGASERQVQTILSNAALQSATTPEPVTVQVQPE